MDRIQKYGGRSRLQSEINSNQNKGFGANILGIDFMHQHKLNYDAHSKQITFAHMLTNALYAVKEVTIPALSSMMVTTKYKGLTNETAQPIATIHAPQHTTISMFQILKRFMNG